MLKKLFFIGLFFVAFTVNAQVKLSKKNIKKAEKYYQIGIEKFNAGEPDIALNNFLESLKINSNNVETLLALADVKMELKDYQGCQIYIEQALTLDPKVQPKVAKVLFRSYMGNGNFEKAKSYLDQVRQLSLLSSTLINEYDSLLLFCEKVSMKNIEMGLKIKNLGNAINSPASEYFPSLFLNDSAMVYTRRINNELNEDFFSSLKQNDIWTFALPLKGGINTAFNEGGQKVSNDGKWMVFTGCNYPEGKGSCDIYYSNYINGEWSSRKNIGYAINTEYWESAPCLSPDKSALYFSSNRPGGWGGMDIYVSYLNEKGEWGAPENLGPNINTKGDEMFPFLHNDNTSFYFTSSGWKSMGGSDVFVSRKTVDGFTLPINLGFPINTIDNESGLVVSASGKTAYFSSDRAGGFGKMDIYQYELPSLIQSFPIKKNESIVLQNIQFETGKWQLKTSSDETLNMLVNYLKLNPNISIQINGHTDNVGNEEDNNLLSFQRAKTVVDYLTSKGINLNRLSYKGYGSAQPIADNATEDGRAKNRRTEMVILSNK